MRRFLDPDIILFVFLYIAAAGAAWVVACK